MSPTLPWFEPTPDSPALPDGGEHVALGARVATGEIVVSVAFQVAPETAGALPRRDPFGALVVLAVRQGTYRSAAFRPAAEAVGLAAERGPGGLLRGHVHAGVFAATGLQPLPGTWHLTAWLGALQSAACAVEIAAPDARGANR